MDTWAEIEAFDRELDAGRAPPSLPSYDWKNPDHTATLAARQKRLAHYRANPDKWPALMLYYRDHIADFISDWGMTYDPRLAGAKSIPFVLFPRQREWVEWFLERYRLGENGITPKSRELGLSWLAMAVSCTMCLFRQGVSVGFGSQVKDKVDNSQNPDSLFWKGRFFLANLPQEFTGGWNAKDNSIDMQLRFPLSGSTITGECGDDIGRGGRKTIYIIDESAHLDHPEMIEASLMGTTNCRIDISSVKGSNNPFGRKMTAGVISSFLFSWRSDPRKDDAWYAMMCRKFDPVTIAQEVDIDISASVEGILIPAVWVRAATDAHVKLGIGVGGTKSGAFDVADEGRDSCAFAGKQGILLEHMEVWKGKGSDIFSSVQRVFRICDTLGYGAFTYDGDGLGSGVRGDARVINEGRPGKRIQVTAFRSSATPANPDGSDVEGRKNKDMFLNMKAQGAWALRCRFERTFKWVTEGIVCSPEDIISISGTLPELDKLVMEMSQPTYSTTTSGKILINKMPEGARSPNRFDSTMMAYSGNGRKPLAISRDALARFGVRSGQGVRAGLAGMRGVMRG